MPSTSSEGLRIPLDSDPFADGALATRNLAADVETRIKRGTDTVQLTAQNYNTKAIVFPTAFVYAIPAVMATSANGDIFATVISASKTGFTVGMYRPAGAVTFTSGFTWLATDL